MKFLVYNEELIKRTNTERTSISSETSVDQLKAHFFETLEKIGDVCLISDDESPEKLNRLCNESRTIFACFQKLPPDDLSCRLLYHSRGALMLPGGFLASRTFNQSTCNIVTTKLQKDQIEFGLGICSPNLCVFTPRLKTSIFHPIKERNKSNSLSCCELTYRFVYAGRWIANKGICQIIRVLNLWPLQGAQLKLIGDFESDFPIQLSNANHSTFPDFFQREFIRKNVNVQIVTEKPMDPISLRNIYWNSDVFLCPSFHEDENFGIAPREAALCGLPVVATDFSGLGQIGHLTGNRCIRTYPTLSGVRFSLRELRDKMQHACMGSHSESKVKRGVEIHEAIVSECDVDTQTNNLRKSCEEILRFKPHSVDYPGWRSKPRFDKWLSSAPQSFKRAAEMQDDRSNIGFFPDGLGVPENTWFSDLHFFQAIQALYTTLPKPPLVRPNMVLRGFWRVSLWAAEQCLCEFGFPGPRRLYLSDSDWTCLFQCASLEQNNDFSFVAGNKSSVAILQKLVDSGFLVPDYF